MIKRPARPENIVTPNQVVQVAGCKPRPRLRGKRRSDSLLAHLHVEAKLLCELPGQGERPIGSRRERTREFRIPDVAPEPQAGQPPCAGNAWQARHEWHKFRDAGKEYK